MLNWMGLGGNPNNNQYQQQPQSTSKPYIQAGVEQRGAVSVECGAVELVATTISRVEPPTSDEVVAIKQHPKKSPQQPSKVLAVWTCLKILFCLAIWK